MGKAEKAGTAQPLRTVTEAHGSPQPSHPCQEPEGLHEGQGLSGTRGLPRAYVRLSGGGVVTARLSPSAVQAGKAPRHAVPIPAASWIPGLGWRVGVEVRLPGVWRSQVRLAGRRGGRGGRGRPGQVSVCRGEGAGLGAPGAAGQLFPAHARERERSPRDGFWSVSVSLDPRANPQQLQRQGDGLRMRPGRTGGTPLQLVLVFSQGKRRLCSASVAGGTCMGPRVRARARSSAPGRRGRRASRL